MFHFPINAANNFFRNSIAYHLKPEIKKWTNHCELRWGKSGTLRLYVVAILQDGVLKVTADSQTRSMLFFYAFIFPFTIRQVSFASHLLQRYDIHTLSLYPLHSVQLAIKLTTETFVLSGGRFSVFSSCISVSCTRHAIFTVNLVE